jgi:hypothetical protein
MNVRIVPREFPNRTELYSGVMYPLHQSDGVFVTLLGKNRSLIAVLPVHGVAEVLLDEEGAVS